MNTAVDAVERTEILIIGAGPAGSVAAAMLRQQGRQVLMLERQQFPRFSIGESLLPQSMEYIEGRAAAGRGRGRLPAQERRGLRARRSAYRLRLPEEVLAGLGHHLPGAARRLRQRAGARCRAHGNHAAFR
jgi:2-polyprenyl-6-methoxyphenol hydroxylase-like FAD-dependent oxidoreductase